MLSGNHGRYFIIRHEKSRGAPPDGEITMTSYLVCNKTTFPRKPCIADKKLLLNAASQSWSLFQNPLWKIVWSASWRLVIKPRYLGNHVSQIKSYYGTLSGNHGGFFRIHQEKSRGALHGGEIRMTSFPAWNKSSLSRKSCIQNIKLLWNAIRK